MKVKHEKFEVRTQGKGTYEITDEVQDKIDRSASPEKRETNFRP